MYTVKRFFRRPYATVPSLHDLPACDCIDKIETIRDSGVCYSCGNAILTPTEQIEAIKERYHQRFSNVGIGAAMNEWLRMHEPRPILVCESATGIGKAMFYKQMFGSVVGVDCGYSTGDVTAISIVRCEDNATLFVKNFFNHGRPKTWFERTEEAQQRCWNNIKRRMDANELPTCYIFPKEMSLRQLHDVRKYVDKQIKDRSFEITPSGLNVFSTEYINMLDRKDEARGYEVHFEGPAIKPLYYMDGLIEHMNQTQQRHHFTPSDRIYRTKETFEKQYKNIIHLPSVKGPRENIQEVANEIVLKLNQTNGAQVNKVLFICGPQGSGKTTLANTVAKRLRGGGEIIRKDLTGCDGICDTGEDQKGDVIIFDSVDLQKHIPAINNFATRVNAPRFIVVSQDADAKKHFKDEDMRRSVAVFIS